MTVRWLLVAATLLGAACAACGSPFTSFGRGGHDSAEGGALPVHVDPDPLPFYPPSGPVSDAATTATVAATSAGGGAPVGGSDAGGEGGAGGGAEGGGGSGPELPAFCACEYDASACPAGRPYSCHDHDPSCGVSTNCEAAEARSCSFEGASSCLLYYCCEGPAQ